MKKRKKRKLIKRIIRTLLLLIFVTVLGKAALNLVPKTATLENGWNLILVNQTHLIPDNYKVELQELSNGKETKQ